LKCPCDCERRAGPNISRGRTCGVWREPIRSRNYRSYYEREYGRQLRWTSLASAFARPDSALLPLGDRLMCCAPRRRLRCSGSLLLRLTQRKTGRAEPVYSSLPLGSHGVVSWVAIDRAMRTASRRDLLADPDRWSETRNSISAFIRKLGSSAQRQTFVHAERSLVHDSSLLLIRLVEFRAATDPALTL
jgi:hypothetical protein